MIFTVKQDNNKMIDEEIKHILEYMRDLPPSIQEYKTAAENLDRLVKAKTVEVKREKLNLNTLAIVVGNIVVTVCVLNYEKLDSVTSRALQFGLKGRV